MKASQRIEAVKLSEARQGGLPHKQKREPGKAPGPNNLSNVDSLLRTNFPQRQTGGRPCSR